MSSVDVSAFVTAEPVDVLGSLSTTLGNDWTLVGGLMVGVHLAARERAPLRVTKDADLVIDARAVVRPPLLQRAASTLVELGFEGMLRPNEAGEAVCHRFVRGSVKVDLLAPEGLRPDSGALATLPATRTIQAPGGVQALRRSNVLQIRSGEATADIRVPSLLGALVVKACAMTVSDHVLDQERDVAMLLTLVDDPTGIRAEIDDQSPGPRRKDLQRLRHCSPLADPDHRGWRGISAGQRDLGIAALRELITP